MNAGASANITSEWAGGGGGKFQPQRTKHQKSFTSNAPNLGREAAEIESRGA